jgi:hypothetical protein
MSGDTLHHEIRWNVGSADTATTLALTKRQEQKT